MLYRLKRGFEIAELDSFSRFKTQKFPLSVNLGGRRFQKLSTNYMLHGYTLYSRYYDTLENEWQVASKNLLPEERKGNMQTKQTQFKSRLNKSLFDIGIFCLL